MVEFVKVELVVQDVKMGKCFRLWYCIRIKLLKYSCVKYFIKMEFRDFVSWK